jgi:hypothetical protein
MLTTILLEDSKILDNIFKLENKKKLKRKYNNEYPKGIDGASGMGLVNITLL